MKRNLVSIAAVVVVFFSIGSAATAQDLAREIAGVWKVLSIERKEVATGKIDKPYGEKPTGYYIYSSGGHFSWTWVAENRTPPAAAAPTDAERVELFKTMSFGTGTFKVEGNKVVQVYDSSWIQSWTGAVRSFAPVIRGDKMTVESAPFKHPITGVDAFTIVAYQRVD